MLHTVRNKKRFDHLQERLIELPDTPGCYIYSDENGGVLYVGKAINLKNRVRSYFQAGALHAPRTHQMVGKVNQIDWIITDSEVEALILECNLIKKHRPQYNVRLRDDKSYPYVCVTINEPYPRVFFTRKPHLKPDGNRYFGPYTEARTVRDSLRLARRIFGVQSCKYKFTGPETAMKPCLYYHLNQCLGPCTGTLDKKEYMQAVEHVCMLFEGRHEEILHIFEHQMEQAAENLQFERAAAIRDRMRSIERLTERQKVFTFDQVDQDIVGIAQNGDDSTVQVFFIRMGKLVGRENFTMTGTSGESETVIIGEFMKQYYAGAAMIPTEILTPVLPEDHLAIEEWLSERRKRKIRIVQPARGEKKRLIELVTRNAEITVNQKQKLALTSREKGEDACLELGEALGMELPPVRIECYDISNLQGGYSVGSMTVFESGLPAKQEYRHFRIKTVTGPDDFASMKEVITRRLARALAGDEKFSDLPDLMLIDGGKGQLSAACEAIAESGEESIFLASLAKKEEEIFLPGRLESIRLPRHSPALRMLQHIRDEAHRFGLSYHRKLRGKGSLHSELDNVSGIGKIRRQKLIQHFGSLEAIRNVTLEELASAPGMNARAANQLFTHLHREDGNESEAA